MKISVLSVYARSSSEVCVVTEIRDGEHVQKESFLLGVADLADISIEVGECDTALYDRICEAALIHRATVMGIRAIGYGRVSERALLRKLCLNGIDVEIARCAIERIKKSGYINENEDAYECALSYTRRLFGKKRIIAELYKKGYADDAVKNAIFSLEDAEIDFAELCYTRISYLRNLPSDRAGINKLIASLVRYGFSADEIKSALNRAYKN